MVAADAKIPQDKVFFLIVASSSSSSSSKKAPTLFPAAFAVVVVVVVVVVLLRLAHVLHIIAVVVSSSPADDDIVETKVRFLNAALHSMHVSFAFFPMMMMSLLFFGRGPPPRTARVVETPTNDALIVAVVFVCSSFPNPSTKTTLVVCRLCCFGRTL